MKVKTEMNRASGSEIVSHIS